MQPAGTAASAHLILRSHNPNGLEVGGSMEVMTTLPTLTSRREKFPAAVKLNKAVPSKGFVRDWRKLQQTAADMCREGPFGGNLVSRFHSVGLPFYSGHLINLPSSNDFQSQARLLAQTR